MSRVKALIILILVSIAVAAVFYTAKLTGGENVKSERPVVICNPQNAPPEQQKCFWTAHIHATVKVSMKGEEIPLGFEQGKLEGSHTHAESNKIHWHELIPVDSLTKEVKDWSALEVSKIALGSQEGNRKFVVNGREVESTYIWQDGDSIEIHYE